MSDRVVIHVDFPAKPVETGFKYLTPKPAQAMAIQTRPQDWAPRARAILFGRNRG